MINIIEIISVTLSTELEAYCNYITTPYRVAVHINSVMETILQSLNTEIGKSMLPDGVRVITVDDSYSKIVTDNACYNRMLRYDEENREYTLTFDYDKNRKYMAQCRRVEKQITSVRRKLNRDLDKATRRRLRKKLNVLYTRLEVMM